MKLNEAKDYIENRLIEYNLTKEKIKDSTDELEEQFKDMDTFFSKSWLDWKCQKIVDDMGVKK